MANKKILIILVIIVVIMMTMKEEKKESTFWDSSLYDCLDEREEQIDRFIDMGPSPWWISPCYKLTSQSLTCSNSRGGEIESGDIGKYVYGRERYGRERLDSEEEATISCAEDYGDPTPNKGDCGGGLVWSNGWCIEECTDTSWSPSPSTVCSGESFTQTSNCGNTRSATGTKSCPVCNTDADTNCDGAVSDLELLSYANLWMAGSISDSSLLQAASAWIA